MKWPLVATGQKASPLFITDIQAGRRAKVAGMSIDAHEQDLAMRMNKT